MTDTMKSRDECVGTLLVHQSDLKELSNASPKKTDECVGTLLVHSSDVQELSSDRPNERDECVGTLLVHQSDMKELSSMSNHSDREDPNTSKPTPTLVRRVTDAMRNFEPDDDDDPSKWLD